MRKALVIAMLVAGFSWFGYQHYLKVQSDQAVEEFLEGVSWEQGVVVITLDQEVQLGQPEEPIYENVEENGESFKPPLPPLRAPAPPTTESCQEFWNHHRQSHLDSPIAANNNTATEILNFLTLVGNGNPEAELLKVLQRSEEGLVGLYRYLNRNWILIIGKNGRDTAFIATNSERVKQLLPSGDRLYKGQIPKQLRGSLSTHAKCFRENAPEWAFQRAYAEQGAEQNANTEEARTTSGSGLGSLAVVTSMSPGNLVFLGDLRTSCCFCSLQGVPAWQITPH